MKLTTLCYLEKDGKYLMLYRNRKKNDENGGKWIGVGGKFENNETPYECMCREVLEETGLIVTSAGMRGIVTFVSDKFGCEYMFLQTVDGFEGTLQSCDEGELEWIDKSEVYELPMWEGDRIFLKLLANDAPYFDLKLCYEDEKLAQAYLDGKRIV